MKRRYKEKRIERITDLIQEVKKDRATWKVRDRRSYTYPWFRGESIKPMMYYGEDLTSPLTPELYRYEQGWLYENRLLQNFRMHGPIYDPISTPPRTGHTDQWLFLARHVGLPTRLLDWTESLFMALYFAINYSDGAVVWMLDWFRLNLLQVKNKETDPEPPSHNIPILHDNVRYLTWMDGLAKTNIEAAWSSSFDGLPLPVAIFPTYIHPRMSAQRSTFTVHGAERTSLQDLVPAENPPLLYKYVIEKEKIPTVKEDLRLIGITSSVAMPDLDGVAEDVVDAFLPPKERKRCR